MSSIENTWSLEVLKLFTKRIKCIYSYTEMSNRECVLHNYVATQQNMRNMKCDFCQCQRTRHVLVCVCVCVPWWHCQLCGNINCKLLDILQVLQPGSAIFFWQFLIAIDEHKFMNVCMRVLATRGNCRVVPAFGADKLYKIALTCII